MSETAVRFDNVSKRFRVGQGHDSIRDLVTSMFARATGRRVAPEKSIFWAVRDVDFSINRGEAVGIVGPNGAGKSTVLKLLAGILRANAGRVVVHGRLAALIEVGAGFHGDLTGRENVFLNGAIMGMTREEIRSKLDAIVDFAGIDQFLDTPVKRYSSGMYARLGFSIAAHIDPEILLVDEVLSVGDAVFRLRCLERMRELVRTGTTLVFVTHNLDQMQAICDRAVVLEKGRCVFKGPSKEAVAQYMDAMSRAYAARPSDLTGAGPAEEAVQVTNLRFLTETGDELVWLRSRDAVTAEVTVKLPRPIPRMVVELNMRASASDNLLSLNSGRDGSFFDGHAGEQTIVMTLPNLPVCGGQYFWNLRVWDADRGTTELDTPFRYPMVVTDDGPQTGALSLEHQWGVLEERTLPTAAIGGVGNKVEAVVTGDEREGLPAR